MKKFAIYCLLIGSMITSCTTTEKKSDNPLLSDFTSKYGVPPFESIKNSDFKPAYEKGIEIQNKEIDAIIANTEAPSFKNTIEALEYSGSLIQRTDAIFGNLLGAVTNDSLQEIAKVCMPMLSKQSDNIVLNEKLFARIKAVYENKEALSLDPEQMKLLEETYKSFARNGANLAPEQKEKLKKINEQLSVLTLQFGDNVLAETNGYKLIIDNKDDLAGLPEGVISNAASAAKEEGLEGKWVFKPKSPSWIPFLTFSEKRELREELFKAMNCRGNNSNANDNKATISKIVALRTEKAQILGFESHAAYTLDDCMAKTPKNVYNLLNKLWTPAIANAKKEVIEMQKIAKKEGAKFKIESWDWWYYAEKVRKEKYNLDDNELRPYFELNNVRNGAFTLANKLFGIQFTEEIGLPLPHPDAKVYKVTEADGSFIGLLYMDAFARSSKRGGAWMDSFRKQSVDQSGAKVAPIITTVLNFSKPADGDPCLLSFDEVTTLFHEFGHALHGLLSDCKYKSLSGTATPRDFVELPSQVMENWCPQPEMLKLYAKHYKTGEVIPQNLIDKIIASGKFNQGFETVEYLAASLLDMDYHTTTELTPIDVTQFEKASMDKIGLINEIIPRYRSTYFNHIFSGGYSAGYYSYIWAAVLDADAFNYFKQSGDIFNKEIAKSFRDNVLSKGGTGDAMTMYNKFRGSEPSIEPLLKRRGLE